MSVAVLETLIAEGFNPHLYWPAPEDPVQPRQGAPRLVVDGDEPLPAALRETIKRNRDVLKAVILLSDPPEWLERLFRLYWAGTETPVRLTSPASGNVEVYLVSLSIKNIAAAVAESIGIGGLQWERILSEVEEALGAWKDSAA